MKRSLGLAVLFAALSASATGCSSGDASDDAGVADASDGGGSDAGDAGSDGGAGDAGSDGGAGDAGGDGGSGVEARDAGGFTGGFSFDGGSGGFGGGPCMASKTPIVFLHGNGDDSTVWSRPASTGGASVLASLQAAGYQGCELFGLTWLTPEEQLTPELVYHDSARAQLVRDFLDAVRAYTAFGRIDVVGHSMGATLALHALEGTGEEAGVRRFVSISGGLRGLVSCEVVGPANPAAPTCGSQSLFDSDTFGFYPTQNARMETGGFRDRPASGTASYYSIRAGLSDEVLCATSDTGCDSALFDSSSSVIAQLDVGQGEPTVVIGDDDSTGVGHFRARSNAGPLLVNMLTTSCAGASCCTSYAGVCGP